MSARVARWLAVMGLSAVMVLSGCAAPSLDRLPLPAPAVGSASYTLTATFANALNLPLKAKVRLGGADIGEVVSMKATDYTAVVVMHVREGVALPVGSVAELRTATPLGDVFVSVKPPADPGPGLLTDGDTLGLGSTASAATVEAVLSSAAVLVNGGVVRDLPRWSTASAERPATTGTPLATWCANPAGWRTHSAVGRTRSSRRSTTPPR